MFPFAYEWIWDIGHIVFFGLFYAILSVVFGALTLTILKTMLDLWDGHIHEPEH